MPVWVFPFCLYRLVWKSTIRMNKLLATHFLVSQGYHPFDEACLHWGHMMESNRLHCLTAKHFPFLAKCCSHAIHPVLLAQSPYMPPSSSSSHEPVCEGNPRKLQFLRSSHIQCRLPAVIYWGRWCHQNTFWFWLISKGGQGTGEMACFEESTQHNKIISTTGNVALVFYSAKPIVIGVSGRYDVSNTWPFNHNQFSYGLLLH